MIGGRGLFCLKTRILILSLGSTIMSDNPNDNLSILHDKRSEAKSRSSKSSRKSKSTPQRVESEEISVSQLEMMANKKKINKMMSETSGTPEPIASEKKETVKVAKTETDKDTSTSLSLSSTRSERREKQKAKQVSRENKNDEVRREKSELLYKFSKMNSKGKWSSLKLDMNNSLDEIKNEVERVRNEIQTERSVGFLKRMLLLGVQGMEMLNTKFDPLGVDLEGWSEAMGYSLENQEYDEVMAELFEKYKGRGQMSPEVKLMFMIISSATMFTISKKITKLDSSNAFKTLIGSFMGGAPQPPQATQQQPQFHQHQQQQQQQQQRPQQQFMQQHMQQHSQFQGMPSQPYIPTADELREMSSDTTEDIAPSRLRGPTSAAFNPDGIDIDTILKTMNERKKEKEMELTKTERSDEGLKNIPLAAPKKRGRPRKTVSVKKQ